MVLSDSNSKIYEKGFVLLAFYLVVDLGRPQDLLPIGFMMPGMISILMLMIFLVVSGKIQESFSRQTTLMWFFILLLSAYIPFSVNRHYAFKTAQTMFLFMPFILTTVMCINTIARLKKLIVLFLCLAVYVEVYSLFHRGLGSGNYFKDENDLSLFANIWLPFFFFLIMHEKKISIRILLFSGLMLAIAVNVICVSRGGFVGLVCVFFVLWLFSPRKILSLAIISLLSVALIFFAGQFPAPEIGKGNSKFWEEMNTIKDTESGTAGSRIESWKAAWRMFLDNPLGVGGTNFPVRFGEYQSDYFERNMWGRAAHSLWFTLLAELGIFGIFIYGWLLHVNLRDIRWFKQLSNSPDADKQYVYYLSLAFIASFAGFFSSGSFLSVLYYPHYWYLTALMVAMRRVAERELSSEPVSLAAEIRIYQPVPE